MSKTTRVLVQKDATGSECQAMKELAGVILEQAEAIADKHGVSSMEILLLTIGELQSVIHEETNILTVAPRVLKVISESGVGEIL